MKLALILLSTFFLSSLATASELNSRLESLKGVPIDQVIPTFGDWYQKTQTTQGDTYSWSITALGEPVVIPIPGAIVTTGAQNTNCVLSVETDVLGKVISARSIGRYQACLSFELMLKKRPPSNNDLTPISPPKLSRSFIERRNAAENAPSEPAGVVYNQTFSMAFGRTSGKIISKCWKSGSHTSFHFVADVDSDGSFANVETDVESPFVNCYIKNLSKTKAPSLPPQIKPPFPIYVGIGL